MTEPSCFALAPRLPRVPPWAVAWLQSEGSAACRTLRTIAGRTGLPISLVAALALVLCFRIARRAGHLALELVLAVALVLAATRAGWIRF
jgi:hypothetical protein